MHLYLKRNLNQNDAWICDGFGQDPYRYDASAGDTQPHGCRMIDHLHETENSASLRTDNHPPYCYDHRVPLHLLQYYPDHYHICWHFFLVPYDVIASALFQEAFLDSGMIEQYCLQHYHLEDILRSLAHSQLISPVQGHHLVNNNH